MEKGQFPKITSEQFPHDMSAWLCQKIEAVLVDTIHLMKTLKGNIPNKNLFDNYPYNDPYYGTVPKEVYNSIYGMLYDITKIYSFSLGADWESTDRNIILDDLKGGLEKLQEKYGLITNIKTEKTEYNIKDFINTLKNLLNGDSYPNRQEINILFDNYEETICGNSYNKYVFKNMERLLDELNLGNIKWNEFIEKMIIMLERINEKPDTNKILEIKDCFTEEYLSMKIQK